MSFEEMVVALVGAIGAFALVGYLAAKIFDLIKSWINRNDGSIPEEEFNRLAKAFMEHKKKTERRLKKLEAISTEQDSGEQSSSKQIEAPKDEIEIEDTKTQQKESGDPNNLRNMLQE